VLCAEILCIVRDVILDTFPSFIAFIYISVIPTMIGR